MKTKSNSVPNFKSFVEQMIDGALKNNDQIVQFHQMIYEKWNFKKLLELENVNYKQNEESLESKEDISATVAHRRSRRYKYKRTSVTIFHKMPSQEDVTKIRQTPNFVSINNKEFINEKEDLNKLDDINLSPIIGDTKVIELWSNSTNRAADKLQIATNNVSVVDSDHMHGLASQRQNEKKLSFEAWKNKKTITYKRIFKKIETEKQQKLLENLTNTKWKKIAQQAQIRKENKYRRKQKLLSKKHFEMNAINNRNVKSNCNKMNEKQIIEEFISNSFEDEKNMKLHKEKRNEPSIVRGSNIPNNDRKNRASSMINSIESIVFCSWLNQLNCALHNKYLRERRHLVRSFYCQPFYYGNEKFYIR